LDHLA
jgi:hypothetical protein